jgi:ABC-type multidrug transport system ATPase subunit/ABC-type transporter Mla maintaining outer membrane lipid asymmetry permease subunit MlaE
MTPPPAVELIGFSLAHAEAEQQLLDRAELRLERGGFYLLVGESGSGKTSLLRLICGLGELREPPPRIGGDLRVLGESVVGGYPSRLRRRVVGVLQDEGLLDDLSPRANVELALAAAGRSPKLALALLAQAGLERPPEQVAQLSGGMRKRVAVARALAAEPELIVFDEPTAGLDADAARHVAELLRATHRGDAGGRTTLVITHDLDAFDGLADAIHALDPATGTIAQLGPGASRPPVGASVPRPIGPSPLHGLRGLLLGTAALVETTWDALRRLPPVHGGLVLRTALRYTLEPALFVTLAAATIGGLGTFFALQNNPLEGAFLGQILTGAGKVLVAVLIPLLAGFFFTARIAAGAAARVGTMKRTNQIAALLVLGVRPADWLLTPMVWGMCVALPVVTFVGIVFGAFASLLAALVVAGIPAEGWAAAFFRTVDVADIRILLLKTVLSGFLVAVLTYHLGSGPKRSGHDVGRSVNAAIVYGMVAVLGVHAVLTFVAYARPA